MTANKNVHSMFLLLPIFLCATMNSAKAVETSEETLEALYPLRKEWREKFEGTNSRGVIDLRNPYFNDFTQFALTQLVNGYGVFHYVGSPNNPSAAMTVAVKQSTFSKQYTETSPYGKTTTYDIKIVPDLPLSIAVAEKCLRFLKNENWQGDSGFPIKVKTYKAVPCPK